MKDLEFPIHKTKLEGVDKEFDLSDPSERKKYFEKKAGDEIKRLRSYLKENSFIAYFIGKKAAGKGTYSKLFREVVDSEHVEHFSVGDMIREVDEELKDPEKRKELLDFLRKNYRGYVSLDEIINSLEERSTKKLLPTELILVLIKKEITEREKKTLFIDGFPRNLDQVSYSLFFRDLVEYRGDPDVFVLIDIPESVIDERLKSRVVCPNCHAPRNTRLFVTKEAEYDKEEDKFYLLCDNPECGKARMVAKEGDDMGIDYIRERLDRDESLLKQAYSLYGVPKVTLRNHVPVEKADQYVDSYEITPEYYFDYDEQENEVKIKEKPFIVKDDNGVKSYSLLAPPVTVSMIKQMASIFCPKEK